jgi:hypothetical protein
MKLFTPFWPAYRVAPIQPIGSRLLGWVEWLTLSLTTITPGMAALRTLAKVWAFSHATCPSLLRICSCANSDLENDRFYLYQIKLRQSDPRGSTITVWDEGPEISAGGKFEGCLKSPWWGALSRTGTTRYTLVNNDGASSRPRLRLLTGRRWWISVVLYKLRSVFAGEEKRQDANTFLTIA